MPFSNAQKLALLTPCFLASRKPMAKYIELISLEALYLLFTEVGAPCLTRLVNAFYPDQFKSMKRDLNTAELTQLGRFSPATLATFLLMDSNWVKGIMRTLSAPLVLVSQVYTTGAPLPGFLVNAHNGLDQTSSQPTLINTLLTELNLGGAATRNLIFNGAGNCVGEVNFANHGMTAVSGHAHVYGVICIPHTGHHAYGTPHIDMADYPAAWRLLPIGVAPATPLGT